MPLSVRRRLLNAGALAALAACTAWPRRALAAPTATTELRWTDPARNRTLPLLLRLPAGDAPCAVILHSHGLGGNRSGGAAWGQAWCDAGFAVLHVQHPGSDSDIFRGGASALRAAASGEQLVNRAGDVRFVIDELERQQRTGAAPWQRLRLDALGLSGHSFGALTTLAAAGQRYPTPGDFVRPAAARLHRLQPFTRPGRPQRAAVGAAVRRHQTADAGDDGLARCRPARRRPRPHPARWCLSRQRLRRPARPPTKRPARAAVAGRGGPHDVRWRPARRRRLRRPFP